MSFLISGIAKLASGTYQSAKAHLEGNKETYKKVAIAVGAVAATALAVVAYRNRETIGNALSKGLTAFQEAVFIKPMTNSSTVINWNNKLQINEFNRGLNNLQSLADHAGALNLFEESAAEAAHDLLKQQASTIAAGDFAEFAADAGNTACSAISDMLKGGIEGGKAAAENILNQTAFIASEALDTLIQGGVEGAQEAAQEMMIQEAVASVAGTCEVISGLNQDFSVVDKAFNGMIQGAKQGAEAAVEAAQNMLVEEAVASVAKLDAEQLAFQARQAAQFGNLQSTPVVNNGIQTFTQGNVTITAPVGTAVEFNANIPPIKAIAPITFSSPSVPSVTIPMETVTKGNVTVTAPVGSQINIA